MEESLKLKGHLKIIESDLSGKSTILIDRPNLIVAEGKGAIMDYLASDGVSPSYVPNPFTSIVLTRNTTIEASGDTFKSKVFDPAGTNWISNEGVLHVPTFTAITHVQGTFSVLLTAIIPLAYGNNPANNHINSVALCFGTHPSTGGPGDGAGYIQTGNEKIFARVNVGDLVKTVDKSYTFQWTIMIV